MKIIRYRTSNFLLSTGFWLTVWGRASKRKTTTKKNPPRPEWYKNPKVEPYTISMAFCELYGEEDSNITDAPKVEPYPISMAFCELYGEEDSNITDAPKVEP